MTWIENWNGEPVPERRPYGAALVVRRLEAGGERRYLLLRADVSGEWAPPLAVRRYDESVEAGVARELVTRAGLRGASPAMVDSGYEWQVWLVDAGPGATATPSVPHRWVSLAEARQICHREWIADLLGGADPAQPYPLRPRPLSDISALEYAFATTVRKGGSFDRAILVIAFTGTYGVGSAGNGDGRFMAAVVKLALGLYDPLGVVLDLRGLSYRWGDMMTEPVRVAVVDGVEPAVVVSPRCAEAMESLLRLELGMDPSVLLCDDLDAGVRQVAARTGTTAVASALSAAGPSLTFEPSTVRALLRPDVHSGPGVDRTAALRHRIWSHRAWLGLRGGHPDDLFIDRTLLLAEVEAAHARDPLLLPGRRINEFLTRYEVAGLETVVEALGTADPSGFYLYLYELPTPLLDLFIDTLERWAAEAAEGAVPVEPGRREAIRVVHDLFVRAREWRVQGLARLA